MSLPLLTVIFMSFLALGYRFYSRYVENKYKLDKELPTPAEVYNDGQDYTPTKPFYLMGQHFSAIAAAGPIAGPIIACQQFGWFPCLLWIGLGAIFIGAVHDFSALMASVRHQARSIAEIVRHRLGRRAWYAMMLFIWIALMYVIMAFTDITASTFVGKSEELEGVVGPFNRGGAVAAASVIYLILAIVMGLVQRRFNLTLFYQTIIFVPLSLAAVWAGTQLSTILVFDSATWMLLILAYCFVASLLPVWLLLQPRGYLGGFILYIALTIGVIGLFFGDFAIQQKAFTGWEGPGLTGALFPFLFVTIACGACSGFHGLVASGTTSKQISKESHCRPVGYGSMLLEGFVALIALSTVMIAAPEALKGMKPGKIYGDGIGRFLTVIIGEGQFLVAATFGAMAFSTFVFDTLDVATRLGRYILQELFGFQGRKGALIATAITILLPAGLLLIAREGAWQLFWTLFGTSNQLLAALSLLCICVWLKAAGRSFWFALIPMLFVMTMTVWSLSLQASWAFREVQQQGLVLNATFMNGMICLLLLFLAGMMAFEAIRKSHSSWPLVSVPAED
jgi:carbon starvation protein